MGYFAFPVRRRRPYVFDAILTYLQGKITSLFFVNMDESTGITQLNFVDSTQTSITRLDMVES